MTVLLIVVFGGAIVGLVANRLWRQLAIADDEKGPSPDEVLTPVTTFAALFIAIVLAGASSSYDRARDAAADEANVVDNMFEATGYLGDARLQTAMQASLVCYARAVRGPGWEAMSAGANSPALDKVPSNWTGSGPHGLRTSFHTMRVDVARGDSRRKRLALAQPSVPRIISAFMLILVALSLVLLGYFIPRRRNTPHRVAVLVAAAVLVLSLALVRSLDRPFRGPLKIEPTAMSITADDVTQDFLEEHPENALPCNKRGEPIGRT